MKRISIYVLSLMLSGAFFVACDDDESNDKLTFDKNSVEVFIDEEVVVKVSGGEAPYEATPVNDEFAEAAVSGSEITIKGVKEGNTTVKVTDKNGLEATIAVEVKEDPYAEEKEDATVRFKWDTFEKVQGTDAGTFTLTKAEDKTVSFFWSDESGENAFLLVFTDSEDLIGGENPATGEVNEVEGSLTVTVDGVEAGHDVTAWTLIQAAPADDEEGTPNTYWVAFNANDKDGIFVAPLSESEADPEPEQ